MPKLSTHHFTLMLGFIAHIGIDMLAVFGIGALAWFDAPLGIITLAVLLHVLLFAGLFAIGERTHNHRMKDVFWAEDGSLVVKGVTAEAVGFRVSGNEDAPMYPIFDSPDHRDEAVLPAGPHGHRFCGELWLHTHGEPGLTLVEEPIIEGMVHTNSIGLLGWHQHRRNDGTLERHRDAWVDEAVVNPVVNPAPVGVSNQPNADEHTPIPATHTAQATQRGCPCGNECEGQVWLTANHHYRLFHTAIVPGCYVCAEGDRSRQMGIALAATMEGA